METLNLFTVLVLVVTFQVLEDIFFAIFVSLQFEGISQLQEVILLSQQVIIVHLTSVRAIIMASVVLRVTPFHFIIAIHHLRVLLMIVMITTGVIVLIIIVVHLTHSTIVHVVIVVSTVTTGAAISISQLLLDKF